MTALAPSQERASPDFRTPQDTSPQDMTPQEFVTPQEHARSALSLMTQWSVPPTPENFAVWFHYSTNLIAGLRQSIDILTSNGQELTPEICADLHGRFCGGAPAEAMRQLVTKIENTISRAVCSLNDAGAGARNYGAALGSSANQLSNESELARIREIVRQVMLETKTMIDRNDLLEQELTRSGEEIDQLKRQVENASREALTDPLTEIGNRKMFDTRLKQCMTDSLENGSDLALVLLDIDHFKLFNDNYGHQFGDLVLRLVAKMLCEGVRNNDLASRYGGEEFALLLPGAKLEDAVKIADMLRTRIAGRAIIKRDTRQNLGNVTLSAGVSLYNLGESPSSFVARADAALYRAKAAGRNRVVAETALPSGDHSFSAIHSVLDPTGEG